MKGFGVRVEDSGLGDSGSGDLLDHVDHLDGCLHLHVQGLSFSVWIFEKKIFFLKTRFPNLWNRVYGLGVEFRVQG